MKLLSQVKGLELVPLPFAEDCCGFGGTFAREMADISGRWSQRKAIMCWRPGVRACRSRYGMPYEYCRQSPPPGREGSGQAFGRAFV